MFRTKLYHSRSFRHNIGTTWSMPKSNLLSGSAVGTVSGVAAYSTVKKLENNKDIMPGKRDILYKTNEESEKSTPYAKTTKPKYDLADIGGSKEIINSFSDVIRYLKKPMSFQHNNIKPVAGIILSGPPGVGKTMLAEAVAGEACVPLYMLSGSECLNALVGETEKQLRDLFTQANANAPCIICIDEIDSIGSKRINPPSQGAEYFINSVVNQLLSLMTQKHEGVIVIGTTNNFSNLDPALTRPGRFDRHIYVPLPDVAERENIIALHLRNKHVAKEVNIKQLAYLSRGSSGAKIAYWMNETAIIAMRDSSDVLTTAHFMKARTIVENGVEGRPHTSEDAKRRTAIHEAGHAMVGYQLGKEIFNVSILKFGQRDGSTEFIMPYTDNENLSKEQLLNEICIAMAGRASEEIYHSVQMGSIGDIEKARSLAKLMAQEGMGSTLTLTSPADIDDILQKQLERARKIIKEHQHTVDLMIDALIKRDELNKTDVDDIVLNKLGSKTHAINTSQGLFHHDKHPANVNNIMEYKSKL